MTNLLTVLGATAGIALLLIMALTPLLADQPRAAGRRRSGRGEVTVPIPAQRRPADRARHAARHVAAAPQAVGPCA